MAEQLNLRLTRGADRSFDAGCPINWLAIHRRARRIARSIALQGEDRLRNGFAIRAYAGDAALLERLRALRQGKQKACRQKGRLRIPPSVLFAVTPAGRRLNAVEARLEQRVAAREAAALCG